MASDVHSAIMTKEEEEEFEHMMRQRRSGRSAAFYGGPPPRIDKGEVRLDSCHLDGMIKSSSFTEPNAKTAPKGKVLQHSSRLYVGYADTVGRRPSMEDDICIYGKLRGKDEEDYIGIFDGHGGKESAEYAAKHLFKILVEKLNETPNPSEALRKSFLETNERMKNDQVPGGTTALVALFLKDKCYIANAGDSRAVLLKDNQVFRMSTDHKPDLPSEEERIQKSGGVVTKIVGKQGKVISRVNGMLAVSRALGDFFLQPHVSPEPEIQQFDLHGNNNDVMLILACDGLWDTVSDEEAVKIAQTEEHVEQSAIKLRDASYNRGSADNISVIVIRNTQNKVQ